ncbi:hypothetical protein [Kitasatospora sp. NPDC007106]|uniref:hypothetical protein n=1 Tax=Kitasatospora sp. NPDC007106 TaxID=3156914 RepID=UPI0033DC1D1D
MTSDLRTCGRAAETVLRETPIFAHLAALWTAAGLTVPGRADPDWDRLTAQSRLLPPPLPSPAAGPDWDRLTAPPRFLPPPLPSPAAGPRPGTADGPHADHAQPDPTPAHLKDCA